MGRWARACILLFAALFTTNLVVMGVARLTYRDPFAPYIALMPGQVSDNLTNYPCQFRDAPQNHVQFGDCRFKPKYGAFGEVTLIITNHVITRTMVDDILPNTLYLGDLILCWGKPSDLQVLNRAYAPVGELLWGNGMNVSFIPGAGSTQAGYSLSITSLSIAGTASACRSV